MRFTTTTLLLSSIVLAAAHKAHVRRQQSQLQPYSNSTYTASPSQLSGLRQPIYTYSLSSTNIAASPVPTLSSPGATSTQSGIILPSFYYSPVSTSLDASTTAPISRYAPNASIPDCGGATLNVLNASLDYWFDNTVYDPIYTLSYMHAPDDLRETGWTILGPATTNTPLPQRTVHCDPTSTLVTATWDMNETFWGQPCSLVPELFASSTISITITEYVSPTAFSGTYYDVPQLVTYPPQPTLTVPGTNYTYDPQTAVVYFTQYEIMSSNLTTYANGEAVCNTATNTYDLLAPYVFTYTGLSPQYADDSFATITDNLDPALPTALGINATLGSFTAVPTIIFVVAEAFSVSPLMRIQHSLLSNTRLAIPSPTLPSAVDATTTGYGYDIYTSAQQTGGETQSSGQFLLIPTPTATSTGVVGAFKQSDVVSGASPGSSDALAVLTQALGPAVWHGLGATTAAPAQTLNFAGATATASTIPAAVVGGRVVAPGQAIVVSGTIISLPTDGSTIVVGDNTLAMPGPGTVINAGGLQVASTDITAWSVAGQTLLPGGSAITVSGTPVSLFAGGGALLIGSSTSMLQTRVITIASQTITADAKNDFVVAGQTLTPSGTITIDGTTYSLAAGATAIIANGRTTPVYAMTAQTSVTGATLTVDGNIITPVAGGSWIVAGQTLTTGGAVTFSGAYGKETISIDNAGSVLVQVISGQSSTATLGPTTKPVLVIGGETFAAQASGGSLYIVNGQTITAGATQTVVVHGTTYVVSLAATPTVAEINQLGSSGQAVSTSYESLWTPASTSAGQPTSSPTSSVTGGATSFAVELVTAVVAGSALAIAAWL